MKKLGSLWLISLLLLAGCNNDDEGPEEPEISFEEQMEIDGAILDEYLSERGIDAEEHESGVRYVITEEGEGTTPNFNSIVVVDYEGRLLDGTVFDRAVGAEFQLTNVIVGWQIGMTLVQSGGSISLYIPSRLAYGPAGNLPTIPQDANIVFDVNLRGVE